MSRSRSSHNGSTSRRHKHKHSPKLAAALALGIAVGMNSTSYIFRAADAAGINVPQSWTENTDVQLAVSKTRGNIPQATTSSRTVNTLDSLSHSAAYAAQSDNENTESGATPNGTPGPKPTQTHDAARTKQLQAILNAGINQNFTTSSGTFYIPLEGHTAPAGMTLIGVRGTFVTASAGQNLDTAIAHINEIRKDAYNSGLVDRYVPISRAPALERTAQVRAVEATVYPGHTRPNGQSFSSISAEGFASGSSETIAWGGRTLHAAIDQWAAEKQNYINARNGNNTGESGHYAALIDPNNKYIGLGMFTYSSGYGTTIVGRFSSNNPAGPSNSLSGSVIQGIYVPNSAVADSTEFTLQSSSIGSKAVFSASTKVLNARALLEAEIKK